MTGFSTPFVIPTDDDPGEFVPAHLPDPGAFLDAQNVLTGEDHVAFHGCTREVFEERTVYDMTVGDSLAKRNLDTRHETAGYRYPGRQTIRRCSVRNSLPRRRFVHRLGR